MQDLEPHPVRVVGRDTSMTYGDYIQFGTDYFVPQDTPEVNQEDEAFRQRNAEMDKRIHQVTCIYIESN